MRRCLIHLYSPSNLLSALAALAALHPGAAVAATILVQLPGASERLLAEILDVVRELARDHPQVQRIEGITDAAFERTPVHDLLGGSFDEFLYTHDATGQVCRRLAQAYPAARKICIGDALGLMYSADFVASYHARPLAGRLRAWLGRLARGGAEPLPALKPDVAVLVLPVDTSGRSFAGVPLTCCPRDIFLAVLARCRENARALHTCIADLLARSAGNRRYLLLTENYAESGLVRADLEIEMYREIVLKYCQPGSAILIKPHPLDTADKVQKIGAALGGDYDVVTIDPRFSRYPIELWDKLLRDSTVVCAAYPMLSLKYVYGIDVVQPMDEEMVERWVEPERRKWMRDSLRLYTQPLARLPGWDGRSVLWSGGAAG